MGAFSLIQWRYTTERGMDCSDCHEPHHQFKKLTERGESSRADLIYWIQDQASKLQVPPDVIKNYIQKVSPPKKVTESLNETPKYKDSTVLEDAHTTPLR